MDWLNDPNAWSALLALLTLEIVLGVDNVVFISILANKLPEDQQDRARRTGILAAGGMRIVLLLAIVAAITLTMRKRPGLKVQNIAKQVAVRAKDRVRVVKMDAEKKQ